jgi:hypothetical protein
MESQSKCLNCNHPLTLGDKYCAACGQKTDAHLLTLSELLSNFWNSITNLDSSAFNTIRYIWAPWKLTKYYVAGKKKSFLNPVRIFLITLIFHFGLIISTLDLSDNSFTKELYVDYEKNKIYTEFLKAKENIDTIQHGKLLTHLDTTLFKDGVLLQNDTVSHFTFNEKDFNLTSKDIVELSIDSIYQKYGFTTFTHKLIAKQLVKSFKDPDGTIRYVLGNLIWAILLTILVLTAFFKLLYWRKKLTFVEHLIFLLNVHALSFIVNSILFYFTNNFVTIENEDVEIVGVMSFFIAPSIIFIISLYKYYQQSLVKTFVKSILSFIVYIITNLFFIFLTGFVSFLLF